MYVHYSIATSSFVSFSSSKDNTLSFFKALHITEGNTFSLTYSWLFIFYLQKLLILNYLLGKIILLSKINFKIFRSLSLYLSVFSLYVKYYVTILFYFFLCMLNIILQFYYVTIIYILFTCSIFIFYCLRTLVIYSQHANIIDAGRGKEIKRHFAISIVATLGNVVRCILAERLLISPIEISCRVSKNTFTQSHTRASEWALPTIRSR